MLAPKFGRRTLHAGVVLMLAGVLSMLWVVHSAGSGLTTWDLVFPELLGGAGMGMVQAPLFDTTRRASTTTRSARRRAR